MLQIVVPAPTILSCAPIPSRLRSPFQDSSFKDFFPNSFCSYPEQTGREDNSDTLGGINNGRWPVTPSSQDHIPPSRDAGWGKDKGQILSI
jgi:hypothetical protein